MSMIVFCSDPNCGCDPTHDIEEFQPVNTEERPEDAARRLAGELLTTQAAVIDATRLIAEMLGELGAMECLNWVPAEVVKGWRKRAATIQASVTPAAPTTTEREGGDDA